jgi:hypothetical protein
MKQLIFAFLCIAFSAQSQSLNISYQGAFVLDGTVLEMMKMRDSRNAQLSKKMAEQMLLQGPSLGIRIPVRRSALRLEGGYSRKQKVFSAELPFQQGFLSDEVLLKHNAVQVGLGVGKRNVGVGASIDFAETEWRTRSTFTVGGLSAAQEIIKNKAFTVYAEAGFSVKSLRFKLRPFMQKSIDQVDFSNFNQQLGNPLTQNSKSDLFNVGLQGGIVF